MIRFRLGLVLCLLMAGCAGPGKLPSPSHPPVKEPVRLNKTYGEALIVANKLQTISYKDIKIAIDPSSFPGQTDYVLLTQSLSDLSGFPKNQKILAPITVAPSLTQQGFANAKGLTSGRMMQLTKNGSFLFVRSAANGYLLEFDNGRNIFVSGSDLDLDMTRQFLYALRDEGKEINMAFIPGTLETSKLVEAIPLLQPEVVILTGPTLDKNQLASLCHTLQEQLFEGSVFSTRSVDNFPF